MGDSYGAQNRKKTTKDHGILGGFVNAPGMRALWHGMGLLDTEWNAAADSLATRAMEKMENAFFLNS